MLILPRLLGRFLRRLFPDLFFNFATPFAREPGPQKSVEQVSEEKHGGHPFIIHDRKDEDDADDKKTRNRFRCSPIDGLEARILKAAEHHEREKKHERRQNEFPFPEAL